MQTYKEYKPLQEQPMDKGFEDVDRTITTCRYFFSCTQGDKNYFCTAITTIVFKLL